MDQEQGGQTPWPSGGGAEVRAGGAMEAVRGPAQPVAGTPQDRRRRSLWRVFWGVVLALSIMINIGLFLLFLGFAGFFAVGGAGALHEYVLRDGPLHQKIAVVSVHGVIYDDLAKDVYRQLRAAVRDRRVKGLIIRVNSPGGTIAASDRIYHMIRQCREQRRWPVVAFMQGLAASGGYYTSVACEKIVAEPTTVTGSIGVISWYLVVQELLEKKLGILPVIIKSGPKKDWPSTFRAPSDEEVQFIHEKLIQPAFERFIEVVARGRGSQLTEEQVRTLADGAIFSASEALEKKLIDRIGYLDEAVELVKQMAGLEDARVVEYRRPFSLRELLVRSKQDLLKLDRKSLYELSAPQVLYLWTGY